MIIKHGLCEAHFQGETREEVLAIARAKLEGVMLDDDLSAEDKAGECRVARTAGSFLDDEELVMAAQELLREIYALYPWLQDAPRWLWNQRG